MNQSFKVFVFSTASLAAGIVIGYKVAEQRLNEEYENRMQEEEELIKEFYSHPARKKYSSPEEAVAELIKEPQNGSSDPREKNQKVAYHKVEKEHLEDQDDLEGAKAAEESVAHNVFSTVRDPDGPYVIDQEEFMSNDPEHEQVTLTYYANGGVLTDVREDKVDNQVMLVGEGFEERFGEGSSDENTVHIRNDKMRMDFEIVRSERSYEEDVLGEEAPDTSRRREG